MQRKMSMAAVAFAMAVMLAVPAVGNAYPVTRSSVIENGTAPDLTWMYNPATHHYYAQVNGMTWPESEAFAVTLGGHLVTVDDADEQAWLSSTFTQDNLWIGLNDIGAEGAWVWSSGAPVSYTNWESGEPNDNYEGGEDGAVMNFQDYRGWLGTWNDYSVNLGCTFYGPAICSGLAGIVEVSDVTPPGFFSMEASVYGNWIHGQDWEGDLVPGDDAHIVVIDVDGTTELLNTTVPVTAKDPGPGGEFSVWPDGLVLQPGMTITATASGITKVLTLVHLTIDSIDRDTGVVTGTGPPNLPVGEGPQTLHVDTDLSPDPRGYISAWPGTDAEGNWTVDFGEPLVPGADTGADINDEDRDATIFDMMVPGQFDGSFVVNIGTGEDGQGQYMAGWGWEGSVAIFLNGNQIGSAPVEDGSFSWWDESETVRFSPGDTVQVVDEAGNEKSLSVADLDVTSIDLVTGRVTGTCDEGMDVALEYSSYEGQPPPMQLNVPCEAGTFEGDFGPGTLPQADPNDPEARGSYVEARQWDAEGDVTQVDAYYPFATVAWAQAVKFVDLINSGEEGGGFVMKLSWRGGSETVTTVPVYDPVTDTNFGRALFTTVLETGVTYTITESQAADGWTYGEGQGDCTFTVSYPADAGRLFTCSYTNIRGFLNPVENPPLVNTTKAGRAVPLRFTIDGFWGLDLWPGSPSSWQVDCRNPLTELGDPVPTVPTRGGELSYNPSTDIYKYSWSTSKAWVNTCRRLELTLSDGETVFAWFMADFHFTR